MLVFLVICFLVLLSLFVLVAYPFVKRYFTKKFFKRIANHALYRLARDEDYYLLNNLTLNLGEGVVIHIDHLLCADKYIYVISDRYLFEGVDGIVEDETLFIYRKNKRREIKNPIRVNEERCIRLAKYLNWTEDKPAMVLSIVCHNNEAVISENLRMNGPNSFFIPIKELYKTIKKREYSSKAGHFDMANLQKMIEHIHLLSKEESR